eukprot:110267_1
MKDWYTADVPESWCFNNDPYYFYQHYDEINGFCEGRVMEHQWISCITDFWILGMAFWQFTWDHNFTILRFVSSCIAVNAVGSFFNHYYGTRQWMVVDNSSMYVELWLIAVVVWDATYAQQRMLFNQQREELGTRSHDWGRPVIRAVLWTICGFVIWALLLRDIVGCKADPDETLFIVGIGIPLVSLVANWILFVKGVRGTRMKEIIADLQWGSDRQGDDDPEESGKKKDSLQISGLETYERMTLYMKWGVGVTVVCAIVWIGVEFPCKTYHWMGYIPGHGVWHVGMSYGLSLIGMWFVCVNSILERKYMAFKTKKQRLLECCCKTERADKCNDCLQRVFPIVTNNVNHERQEDYKTCECCALTCKHIREDICGGKSDENELGSAVNDQGDNKKQDTELVVQSGGATNPTDENEND